MIVGIMCFAGGFLVGGLFSAYAICCMLDDEVDKMRNGEGYIDKTAGAAVMAVTRQEQEIAQANHELIGEFRAAAEHKGFEIVGRITLKHKKSGRVFR